MPYRDKAIKKQREQAKRAASPKVLCACGCGELIDSLAVNGTSLRFARQHSSRMPRSEAWKQKAYHVGPDSHGWKGGEFKDKRGYFYRTIPEEQAKKWPTAHKAASNSWRIKRSHAVWNDAHPDDIVQAREVVHHLNRGRSDDRIENLYKHGSQGEHLHDHPELRTMTPERRRKLSDIRRKWWHDHPGWSPVLSQEQRAKISRARQQFEIIRDAKGRIITSVRKGMVPSAQQTLAL